MVELRTEAKVRQREIGRRGRTARARAAGALAPLAAGLLALLAAGAARAADTTVAAGGTLSLTADIVLMNGDNFVAGDDSGTRCVIHGNGFSIAAPANPTGPGWTGGFSMHNCDVDGLGAPDASAITLTATATGSVSIVGSTFSTSNRIVLDIADHVNVTFSHNTIQADSITPEVTAFEDSEPAFWSTGASDGTKVIQGNRIFRGRIKLTSSSGWLIGGSMPGDGNIMFGVRTGIELESDAMITVRGNYSRTDVDGPSWNQVKNLAVDLGGGGNIIEHNIFVGENWTVEMDGGGELRYNLLVNNIERGWVLAWADAGAKIHHNLVIATRDDDTSPLAGFVVEEGAPMSAPTTQIYNNTIDLGGTCTRAVEAAVTFIGGSVLESLRSNAIVGVREAGGTTTPGLVRADDAMGSTDHLLYADYNLFFTPDSPVKTNYAVTVPGKTVRVDPGFAFEDAP